MLSDRAPLPACSAVRGCRWIGCEPAVATVIVPNEVQNSNATRPTAERPASAKSGIVRQSGICFLRIRRQSSHGGKGVWRHRRSGCRFEAATRVRNGCDDLRRKAAAAFVMPLSSRSTCALLPHSRIAEPIDPMIHALFCAAIAALAAEAVELPPAFDEICWSESAPPRSMPSVQRMRELFSPVDGFEGKFESSSHHDYPLCQMKGLFRLKEPWQPETAIRFSHRTYRYRRFFLWRGREGVALYHHPQFNNTAGWAAYRVVRDDVTKPLPSQWEAVAYDEGRVQQMGMGTHLLLCDGKRVTLARGGMWVLAVPFEGRPDEVFVDWDAQVFGFEFVPCRGGPTPPPMPELVAEIAPGQLEWKAETGEEAAFDRNADGVVLSAAANKPGARAVASLPPDANGRLICFQIDQADRGAGVLVADAEGNEICRLAVCGDQNRPDRAVSLTGPGDNNVNTWIEMKSYPVPLIGKGKTWVGILVGDRVAKLALSPDGSQWTYYTQVINCSGKPPARIGVYCVPHQSFPRSIALRAVQVRRPKTAPGFAEISLADYLRSVLDGPGSLAERRSLIVATATMINGFEGGNRDLLVGAVQRLVDEAVAAGEPSAFSQTWLAAAGMGCPQRFVHRVRWNAALESEAMALIYRFDWAKLRRLAEMLRSWQGPRRFFDDLPDEERSLARTADWIESTLPRPWAMPRRERGEGGYYRPLFTAQTGKEGFNAMTELLSTIDGKAYREACQIITGPTDPAEVGLTPDPHDPRLFCDYAVVVRGLIERSAELREVMKAEFGQLGALRLQTAVNNADHDGLANVAVQFVGTPAASEARYRLGDQSLSSGRFHEAMGHYRLALRDTTDAKQLQAIASRMRLTAAMMGVEYGSPVRETVRLGNVEIEPEEFERIVDRMRRRQGRQSGGEIGPSAAVALKPPAGPLAARAWGPVEDRSSGPAGALPRELDWSARQMGLFPGASLLAVSRGELSSWKFGEGRREWSHSLETAAGKSPWPMIFPRPVRVENAIFVRRPAKEQPDLACIDAGGGGLKWTVALHDAVAADPIAVGRELLVFSVQKVFPQKVQLIFSRIDIATGQTIASSPLAEFLDVWEGELPCQAVQVDDKIVATAGGAVICCRLDGRLQWVRQQVWIPPRNSEEQPRPWCLQEHAPPAVREAIVAAFQPGMRAVEFLDLVSGRLVGVAIAPEIDQVVGFAGERLVIRAGSELWAIERTDEPADLPGSQAGPTKQSQVDPADRVVRTSGASAGFRTAWRHAMPQPTEAIMATSAGDLIYVAARLPADENAPIAAEATWLDSTNGRVLVRKTIEGLTLPKALFGPLSGADRSLWLLVGTQEKPQERTLWEIGEKR